LARNKKRWRFEEILEVDLGLHYIFLWFSFVAEQAPLGDVTKFSPKEISKYCEWHGDPELFIEALIGSGFVEAIGEGVIVSGWWEENGYHIREMYRSRKLPQPRDPRDYYAPTKRGRPRKNAEHTYPPTDPGQAAPLKRGERVPKKIMEIKDIARRMRAVTDWQAQTEKTKADRAAKKSEVKK